VRNRAYPYTSKFAAITVLCQCNKIVETELTPLQSKALVNGARMPREATRSALDALEPVLEPPAGLAADLVSAGRALLKSDLRGAAADIWCATPPAATLG
jgi:hypothetical protein